MAPNVKGTPKSTPQMHRINNKSIVSKTTATSSPSKRSVITTVKKTTDRTVVKGTTVTQPRQRTKTAPVTPKPKENSQNIPTSVTKSGSKPSWKRRPRPAHSGVPVPEKMRKLLNKFLEEENRLDPA